MDLPRGTVLLDESFGATVVNATDVSTPAVYEAMSQHDRALLATFENWVENTRPKSLLGEDAAGSYGGGAGARRNGGIFMRDRYITPMRPWDQMRLAYEAATCDDVVGGICEMTESLAFSQMDIFALQQDEQDAYNQIAANIDLDRRMREIWRELFMVSQAYIAVWWERQTFKVRGRTPAGNQRRREFTCIAPTELSLLDPLKVVPIGSTLFGNEGLAYIASPEEASQFDEILGANRTMDDEIVQRLVTQKYEPSRQEILEFQCLGVPDTRNLYLLNPENVFRHTLTRPAYDRLAPVRMKSVFELLDMKAQLRQMERAHLIGATNFIIIITKGSDQLPAQPQEIANLQSMVRTLARVPVLVGDHRLNVEIVTPKLDNTLKAERWNTIDSRITGRLLQLMVLGNYAAGASGDDSIKLVKVMARGMESRRHMIRRTLEKNIFRPLLERNPEFTSMPKLQFHPQSIALDFDAAYASFLFDLRQANEISRETILNQFDLDEGLEAELRLREKVFYDPIFQTQVPYSSPNPANTDIPPSQDPNTLRRDNGGGRRNGGGAAPGTGQGQPPRRRPARPAAASEDGGFDGSIHGEELSTQEDPS